MSSDDERSSFTVRPYTVTRGRTRTDVELALETMVRATDSGRDPSNNVMHESGQILAMAGEALSVAEISAHLKVPLQVAKVLIGDLVESGHLETHALTASNTDERPDLRLLCLLYTSPSPRDRG